MRVKQKDGDHGPDEGRQEKARVRNNSLVSPDVGKGNLKNVLDEPHTFCRQ